MVLVQCREEELRLRKENNYINNYISSLRVKALLNFAAYLQVSFPKYPFAPRQKAMKCFLKHELLMESLLARSGRFEDQMHFSWTQGPLCCTEAFEFLGIFIIAKLDFTCRHQ